jgi:exodeoxyribonuclease VII large subunit
MHPTLFSQPPDPSPSEPSVLRVSELAASLRKVVEGAFEDFWVEGEISNFKRPASGHCYFTLKDGAAQLRCVMWRSSVTGLRFSPQDGLLVQIRGKASVYEERGDLQIVASAMRPAGEGALQAAFEALKRRLSAEGLFDASTKKPLPDFPRVIGVVTSGTGAAFQDILTVLERRCPLLRVVIAPVPVQGVGSGISIAAAIDRFNALHESDHQRPDVLIVGRGGGSIEDLWAFNEEIVARAIFASDIPVVSAVGHETDFSIADFVADVRAATPSMAAEIVAPDLQFLAQDIRTVHHRTRTLFARRVEAARGSLREHHRYAYQAVRRHVQHLQKTLLALLDSQRFQSPVQRVRQTSQRLDHIIERMDRGIRVRIATDCRKIEHLRQRIDAFHPLRPLDRGFVHVSRGGETIVNAASIEKGDELLLHFRDGSATVDVKKTVKEDASPKTNFQKLLKIDGIAG